MSFFFSFSFMDQVKVFFSFCAAWTLVCTDFSSCGSCEVASVVSNSVRPHRRQPTGLRHPWDSPGKNTGVGCHLLLQCIKVKSESEVAQLCLTLSDPMDIAYQAPPSMGFSRQEYWSGVPSPSPYIVYKTVQTYCKIKHLYVDF